MSAVGVVIGVVSEMVGEVVSITIALFADRFVVGVKLVIAFPAWSVIVPETLLTFRSLVVSPAWTV